MRFTLDQAKALGGPLKEAAERIESEDAGKTPSVPAEWPCSGPPAPSEKRVRRPGGGPNKLESAFLASIDPARVMRHLYEPITFRLAGQCRYTPDVFVVPMGLDDAEDRRFTFIEVKGRWFTDDSKVKIKVAASMFPMFRWLLVFRSGSHGWDIREVDVNGIGRTSIEVRWIRGAT